MRRLTLVLGFMLCSSVISWSQSLTVNVKQNTDGWKLYVGGEPFMVNGINWDYFPIGTNYSYSLWEQSPEFVKKALDDEMSMLRYMGVNTIRVYSGIPKEWITYIYETYGIYTMLNHSFGRYGLTIEGAWVANTEYSDPRVRSLLLAEVKQLVNDYKNTPGLLLYLLGNENNYGLFWEGAETEDIPIEDRKSTERARALYKLMDEAAKEMKKADSNHPVAICNGDVLFLDIIAEEVKSADIFGVNVYRGISFTDLYDSIKKQYNKPVLLTEFGSDAFNAKTNKEDQNNQAIYDKANWREIYENAAGYGKANNSIGGFTFQFSDGWWKTGQTKELDVHNNQASWVNGGYQFDFAPGVNNMNEEWFGIMAKGPTDAQGFYELFPRTAYYVLKEVHKFDVYAQGQTIEDIKKYFNDIDIFDAYLRARNSGSSTGDTGSKIKLSRFTANFTTFNTGGDLITTPEEPVLNERNYPNQLGFDHMQSFFVGVEANPAPNMRASMEVNILGNVAQNPIDELFYENRGAPAELVAIGGNITSRDLNRVSLYRGTYTWDQEYFKLDGFYRTGHYHWAYEGDFFNLYPEANYGPNIDIYNGNAPLGFEAEGKKQFQGLKVAFGPELWWGANPAILVKYTKTFAHTKFTSIWHEDLQQIGSTASSFAIPQPKTRRVTLHAAREFGKFGVQFGGIWGGQPLNGREFQIAREQADGSVNVYVDKIKSDDNWGGKAKFTYAGGVFNWYASSAVMGLVANGGADQELTFTGWRLKDSGSGNQYNVLSGFTYTVGNLQIAPNFLWQKPIEGPVPGGVDAPGRPRNILSDPFVVRANREQIAGEVLFTFDPTPGSWMYNWDSDRSEDAEFAMSLGIVYRHLPTTQDASIGILPDGRTFFAFPNGGPAQDLLEVNARIVSKLSRDLGIIAVLYGGNAQANGDSDRILTRFGGDLRVMYNHWMIQSFVRFNDWGPFDYHRDFNLTFPLQTMIDVSTNLNKPDWFNMPSTRFGFRATYRTLDQYSPRYAPAYTTAPDGSTIPDPTAPGFGNGSEWEFRTYIQINITN